MYCGTCDHEHQRTEQAVRYSAEGVVYPGYSYDQVESTMMVCTYPGCLCSTLDPVSADDRIALIKAGELDG